jgi:microcystin-dependent protein
MTFRTIHTAYGLQRMAQAEATGTPINITHIAVGDGNGNPVDPAEAQTVLVREVYRATVNRVFQDPAQPTRFTAELVIPATAGGFVMREVGVFDADGGLFVVGNLPATYKPMASEGAYADTILRVEFMVTNASVVTLQIDPNVAVASQAWVLSNVNTCALLPGGTTGQVLRKASNGCGDTEWADPTDVNVLVNSIEETQTLAAAQTVVDWSVVNNTGLAVYIEGVRLRADQWTPHPTINTRVTLAASYPAGTKIVGAQNEPAGTLGDPLQRAQNLADLPDKATARANLDVFSRAEVRNMIPPGIVDHFDGETPPPGWFVRDGSAVSRTAYPELFARIGTRHGAGDGFNTFNLPDDRDLFDRGWGGVTSGRALGSYQADEIKLHGHPFRTGAGNNATDPSGGIAMDGNGAQVTQQAFTGTPTGSPGQLIGGTGGAETRPKNRAYLPIIKF